MLFLTDQFSGRQCDLVTLVLGKLNLIQAIPWLGTRLALKCRKRKKGTFTKGFNASRSKET